MYPPKSPHHGEPYGFMERELVFKLLAAHALVDHPFLLRLRKNPKAAAAELHISLTPEDVNYIKNQVNWKYVTKEASGIREALNLEAVTNSW